MAMNERLLRTQWVENLLRPVLIAGMMACLAAPLVVGLEWLLPGWDGTYFLVFAFFASLEGILSERTLHKRGITGWGYYGSRAAEAMFFLLLLKLLNYIPRGFSQLLVDAQTWLADPGGFINWIDLFTGSIFLPLWLGSLYVARMLSELDVEKGKREPPPDKTSVEYYLWLTQPPIIRERQERLGWLVEIFLWGGIALLLASALVHFFVSTARVLAIPTLLYFTLGIALLSQARFSVTHASWEAQGLAIQAGISRRWLVWAVIFFAAVGLVALLLPTYYSMGPLQAVLGLLSILYSVLSFLLSLLLFLLLLPLALLLPEVEPRQPPVLDVTPFAPQQVVGSGPPAWLQVVGSMLFWLVVLAIVGYALVRFWRDRFAPSAEGEGADRTWWDRVRSWFRALWQRWWAWRQEVQGRLVRRQAGQKGREPIAVRVSRFFRPGRLSPRELIRYFYLSATRRAAQAGQVRHPAQTPYEYQYTLDQRFPELEPDLEGLTKAFIEARYSHHEVQQADAEAVKPLWQRVKAALQQRRVRS